MIVVYMYLAFLFWRLFGCLVGWFGFIAYLFHLFGFCSSFLLFFYLLVFSGLIIISYIEEILLCYVSPFMFVLFGFCCCFSFPAWMFSICHRSLHPASRLFSIWFDGFNASSFGHSWFWFVSLCFLYSFLFVSSCFFSFVI